jgi:hypothetical protein
VLAALGRSAQNGLVLIWLHLLVLSSGSSNGSLLSTIAKIILPDFSLPYLRWEAVLMTMISHGMRLMLVSELALEFPSISPLLISVLISS